MARISREGQFKIEQRAGEAVDITLLRCFMKALPYIDRRTALAAAEWMYAKAIDRKTWREIRFSDIEVLPPK